MEFTKLSKLAKGNLTEARRTSDDYEGSHEFTDELMDLQQQIIGMKKIMRAPRWMRWMGQTDENFLTKTKSKAQDALFALSKLEEALRHLDEELDKAE